MILYRSFILSAVLLVCSFCCRAQDSNYVYVDSAVLYDSVSETESTDNDQQNNEGNDFYVTDTVLRDNQLSIESDSIRVLKNSKPFSYAKRLDSLLQAYQQAQVKDEPSANSDPSWIARFFLSPLTKYFFLMLAGVFIFFILYKLFFSEGFFQRPYAKINVTLLPDEKEDLSNTADYGRLIAQAVSKGKYRLAIRYHYLQSLQKLSSKSAIQFAPDKTNYQYVRELSGKKYKDAFASLTLNYEYVWYGGFEIDENGFNSIQNKFKQFNTEV